MIATSLLLPYELYELARRPTVWKAAGIALNVTIVVYLALLLRRRAEVAAAVRIPKKLLRVVPEALQRFYADHCPQQAAGIAYRVLFSIAPLAIVLVSIFGLVLQDDSVRQDVVNTILDALPVSASGSKDVEDAITAIASPASAAGPPQPRSCSRGPRPG